MTDVNNINLSVGDKVLVNCGTYQNNIVQGIIIGFTPKRITVQKVTDTYTHTTISNYQKVIKLSALGLNTNIDYLLNSLNEIVANKK